jgi:uncharacterized protein
MKLALFGARGMIGSRLLAEALQRGHAVTTISRRGTQTRPPAARFIAIRGDVLDPGSIAVAVTGHDAVLSAVGPTADIILGSVRALVEGLTRGQVMRLLVIGGAGSLEVAPGVLLLQTPQFPVAYEEAASAHRDALRLLRQNATLDWTVASPPAVIEPGRRTGVFRVGGDQLLTDADGASRISAEDFAVAVLDEIEKPRHVRGRFTAAY